MKPKNCLLSCIAILVFALALLVPTETWPLICVSGSPVVRAVRGVVAASLVVDNEVVGVVPGAVVDIERGRFHRQTISDEDGYFSFSNLPQGTYTIRVEEPGFASAYDKVKVRSRAPAEEVLLVTLAPFFDCSYVETVSWRVARDIQIGKGRDDDS